MKTKKTFTMQFDGKVVEMFNELFKKSGMSSKAEYIRVLILEEYKRINK